MSVVSPWSPTPLTLADGGHGEDVEALDILATSAVVLTLSPSRRVPLPAPIWRPLVRSPWGHPRTSPCRGPQLELPCSVQDWSLTRFSFLSFIQSSIIVKIVFKKNTLRQFCHRRCPFFIHFFTKSKHYKMWVSVRTWWYCCWYRHRCRNLLRSHFLRSDGGPLRFGGAPIIPFCSYPHNFLHSCGAHQNCCGGGHCACCLLLHGSLRSV